MWKGWRTAKMFVKEVERFEGKAFREREPCVNMSSLCVLLCFLHAFPPFWGDCRSQGTISLGKKKTSHDPCMDASKLINVVGVKF